MNRSNDEEHLTNKLAVSALRKVAEEQGIPYSKLKQVFADGDEESAAAFWRMLGMIAPDHQYNAVYVCPDCKKFDLEREEQEHKAPWYGFIGRLLRRSV